MADTVEDTTNAGKTDDSSGADDKNNVDDKNDGKEKPSEDKPTITQLQLDAIIKDRLEQQTRKHDAATEKAAKKASDKKLTDDKAWEKLASERDTSIKELEPKLADTVSQLEAMTEKAKGLEATLGTPSSATTMQASTSMKRRMMRCRPTTRMASLLRTSGSRTQTTHQMPTSRSAT